MRAFVCLCAWCVCVCVCVRRVCVCEWCVCVCVCVPVVCVCVFFLYSQPTLTRGNNLLTECVIRNWSRWKRTYQPGISWAGVGNNYTHNTVSNAPHAGILGGGQGRVHGSIDLCGTLWYTGEFSRWLIFGNSRISVS